MRRKGFRDVLLVHIPCGVVNVQPKPDFRARGVVGGTGGLKIWDGFYSKKFPKEIQRIEPRKLVMIHRAKDVQDLMVPSGNRLEQLDGDRRGQYSIRINDQFRICFRWNNGAARDVEIIENH